MIERIHRWLVAVAVMGMSCAVSSVMGQTLAQRLNERVLMVPAAGVTEPELEVTVFMPIGSGPFPVAIINHGRVDSASAKWEPRYRPLEVARELVQRGYAVVAPMRKGFSKSGGQEILYSCDFSANGRAQAESVRRAVQWVEQQPWADARRQVVIGAGLGGYVTLAYGAQAHDGTRLLINLRGAWREDRCADWNGLLRQAMADYAAKTSVPSLWIMGDGDNFAPPSLIRSLHAHYVQSGGHAELMDLSRQVPDIKTVFSSASSVAVWMPKALAAMKQAGLPVDVVADLGDLPDLPKPASTGYAQVTDMSKLPLVNEAARQAYAKWLQSPLPRAFAIHPDTGAWGAAWGGDRPIAGALERCVQRASTPCWLYAVDQDVVWSQGR